MKNEHILDILDNQAFGEFSDAEKAIIQTHTAQCSNCLHAYQAARLSSVLLKTSVTQNFAPSPFFQARVLANLREKQVSINPFFAIGKLWRASSPLVAMMVTAVVVLIVLTVFAPNYNKVVAGDSDSADIVILDEKMPTKELNNEQIFQILYEVENNKEK